MTKKTKPRPLTPRKLFEGWFSVFQGAEKVGLDWIFWEPHSDGTAWFERRVKFGDVDAHCQARFAAGAWPELKWLRFRDHEKTTAREKFEPRPDVLPHFLLPLVAAAAPTAPGEVLRFSLYEERTGETEPGYALLSHGPETIETAGVAHPCTRYTVEREGRVFRAAWVDANRRIRKIDYGGPTAILTTRDAASS